MGNLAVAHPGSARLLIIAITAYLRQAGFEWVSFTAVPALANTFARMGLETHVIGEARSTDLPTGERAAWGRYYDVGPRVYAASIVSGYADISNALGCDLLFSA